MEVHSVKIVSSLGVEMFRGDVEVGNQQTVLAPHPLQQAAPALLPQEDGAARSPGGQSVASTGPSCPPRAPGSVQVAETDTVTITSHRITSHSDKKTKLHGNQISRTVRGEEGRL